MQISIKYSHKSLPDALMCCQFVFPARFQLRQKEELELLLRGDQHSEGTQIMKTEDRW